MAVSARESIPQCCSCRHVNSIDGGTQGYYASVSSGKVMAELRTCILADTRLHKLQMSVGFGLAIEVRAERRVFAGLSMPLMEEFCVVMARP
jgi:hypothetical protein